ncbi:MAG: hypothetical protein RR846_07840 [Oscillospiraceae bacterium]
MAGACKEFLEELKVLNEQYLAKIYDLSTIYKTQGREPYDDACHLEDFNHAKEVYALREKYGYPNKSEPKLKMR